MAMTFDEKHRCILGDGSDSMLPKKTHAQWWDRVWRSLRKLMLVSERHPLTFEHIRSYPAMVADRLRQVTEAGSLIHPFSLFSLFWNNFMVFVDLAHLVVSSLRLCYYLNPLERPDLHYSDFVLLALHALCVVDMIVRFNMGYLEGKPPVVVLHRRSIVCHYLSCTWLPDCISSVPISFMLIYLGCTNRRYFLITHSLPLFRTIRLCSILTNLRIFLRMLTRSCILCRLVIHMTVFALIVHCFNCLVYFPSVVQYYWQGYIPERFSSFLMLNNTERNITQLSVSDRYIKAMFISISALYGTGFSVLTATRPSEILVNCIIILGANMFMIYNIVFFLKIYMTVYNSSMRYQELMNQVEKYMRHKQFPAPLKKRVRAFYNYRYQERYFKEETALSCLSEQLCSEISLHTCQNLLQKVSLFEALPTTLVGTVIGCLKPEVYLPNDLIIRAGDVADCMYFLSNGTVAVYTLKGAEVSHTSRDGLSSLFVHFTASLMQVCHLEDGDYFGHVALLVKDRKRLATVVAIEITQVYRLDDGDFRRFIMSNPELSSRIEADATRCGNETLLIDDGYRRERERRAEQLREQTSDGPVDKPF